MMSFHSTSFRYSVSVKAAGWGWHVLLPALVFSRFSTLSHPKAVHKRRMGVSTLSQWERVRGAGASDRDGRVPCAGWVPALHPELLEEALPLGTLH